MRIRGKVISACTLFALGVGAATSGVTAKAESFADENAEAIKAIAIVDCLLPGQMRRSGMVSYLGPRLPVKATARDCELRGGEYVEYDRATLKSSLAAWQEKAEAGDAQAQFYVGQIYEKGMDAAPDYASAAQWYRKAAAQGSTPAKLALVDLMVAGKGVNADPIGALNLYREAMGVNEKVVRESEADQRVDAVRKQLEAQKTDADAKIVSLKREIDSLRRNNAAQSQALIARRHELASLQTTYNNKAEIEKLDAQEGSPRMRSVVRLPSAADAAPITKVGDVSFGRYYALIIGVQDYADKPLKTPIADAEALADVLEHRYGFRTTVLRNPDTGAITNSLVHFVNEMRPDDNLLIYFAGHGVVQNGKASWLARDKATGLPSAPLGTEMIASLLGQIQARSILVIADACFAGKLAGSDTALTPPDAYREGMPTPYLQHKGRYVLASGGDEPVLDEGAGSHSVFAAALLDALGSNTRVLTQAGLKKRIEGPVALAASRLNVSQHPDLLRLRDGAEIGAGLFFFVPNASANRG
jgi:hypothetical protein